MGVCCVHSGHILIVFPPFQNVTRGIPCYRTGMLHRLVRRGNPIIASNVCVVTQTNFQGFENIFGKSPKPSNLLKGNKEMNPKDEKRNQSRRRKNRIVFCVDDDELKFIQAKMKALHIKNRGAYLRKMAIDGQCIRYDYSEFEKEIRRNNYLLSNLSNNLNQIARRVNSTGNIYDEDFKDIHDVIEEIWEEQKKILRLFMKETEEK